LFLNDIFAGSKKAEDKSGQALHWALFIIQAKFAAYSMFLGDAAGYMVVGKDK